MLGFASPERRIHSSLFLGLLSTRKRTKRSVCRTDERVFFIVFNLSRCHLWTQKRREVGRYSHVCCLRQILTPNACRSYRHRVCLGLLCKSTQKSRIYQTFLLFLAINSPCRRCKPKHPSDSCIGIAAVLSPFLAPLSRFLPSCVQFRLLTRKIVSER